MNEPITDEIIEQLIKDTCYTNYSIPVQKLIIAYRNVVKDCEHYKKQAEEANAALAEAALEDGEF